MGPAGLTWPDRRHIEINVKPGWSDAFLRHVVAHELGHAVDLVMNDSEDRAMWRELRGITPGTRWWAEPWMSDFAAPSGDFAECFAAWAIGTSHSHSKFGSCSGTASAMTQLVQG